MYLISSRALMSMGQEYRVLILSASYCGINTSHLFDHKELHQLK